jgi:FtsZ-binding cell division protein ZapB
MTDRPLDEVYDTIRDVEQDPMGALMAIQQLVAEADTLRAEVTRLQENNKLLSAEVKLLWANSRKQRAEVARLREALEHSKTGWENVVELELFVPAHGFTASGLLYEARAALEHGEADQ